jgi:hypothetical protein
LDQSCKKFKDQRTILKTETQAALTKFFHSVNFDEVWTDFKDGITDKTPNVKIYTFILLEKYFEQFQEEGIPAK